MPYVVVGLYFFFNLFYGLPQQSELDRKLPLTSEGVVGWVAMLKDMRVGQIENSL